MAVIQKIRNQYGKIAGAVIAIALISFIVSDARNGSFGSLFGGRETYVVSVDGTKIESKIFEQRVKEYEILTSIYSNRPNIDDAARAQIREQVLSSVTFETMVEKICDKVGIITSEQERKEMIYGQNAHPLVRQFNIEGQQVFNNEQTKQFDPSRVKGLEEQLASNPKLDPYGKITENWNTVKQYVLRMSRIDKFNTMMAGAVYSPKYIAAKSATDQNMMASIRYVKVPYTAIPDNDVKVTDDDINKYIDGHKGLFQVDQAFRSLDYVSFDIIPSSADSMRSYSALTEIKDEFTNTKDNKSFVSNKTDDMSAYSEMYLSKKNLQSQYADTFQKMAEGTVFGPYFENNSFRLTKITSRKVLPDSTKIRHILIRVKERDQVVLADSLAKKRMDSVVAAIKGGANFDSMVKKYSDDAGSKDNHGEYWLTLQQRAQGLDSAFAEFSFGGKTGESKLVKGENAMYTGYHYIEILDQKSIEPTVQLATISKNLLPSDSTVNAIFSLANEFAAKSLNANDFDGNVKKMGYQKRQADNIKESSFNIQGLGSSREVIKWAFEHKVGDVSTSPFQVNDQRYVVAKLNDITEKGKVGITPANRPMLEQRVKEEKKAEAIRTKFKGASLESIAQGTGQQVAQSDSVVLGAAYIPNVGYEPKVVGFAFNPSFAPNTVSPGIKAQGGVYFISLLSKSTKPVNPMEQQMMIMQQRGGQEQQLKSYLSQTMPNTLTRNVEVKYNIANF